MMRSWLANARGSFPSADDGLPENGSATYRLSSELDKALFTASIYARWLPPGRGGRALVLPHLRQEGDAVTKRFSVLDVAAANDALNMTFARMHGREIPGAGVRLVNATAMLRVDEDHRDFAERKASIERQARLDAAEVEATLTRLVRVRDVFFRDSAMACLWWSDGKRDKFLELDTNKDKFGTIVNLLTGSPAGHAEADRIAGLIDLFLKDLGPDHREYLAGQLGQIFTGYARPDLASELGHPG